MDTANKIAAFISLWHARFANFLFYFTPLGNYPPPTPLHRCASVRVVIGEKEDRDRDRHWGDHNYVRLSVRVSAEHDEEPPDPVSKDHHHPVRTRTCVKVKFPCFSVGQSLIYSPRNKFNCRTISYPSLFFWVCFFNDMTWPTMMTVSIALFYEAPWSGTFNVVSWVEFANFYCSL